MKVTCIRSVTLGALGLAFVDGEKYDVPIKVANDYKEYFKKNAKPKSKKTD